MQSVGIPPTTGDVDLTPVARVPAMASRPPPPPPPRTSSRHAGRYSAVSDPSLPFALNPPSTDINFSRLRARHASDPQLSTRFKSQAQQEFGTPETPDDSGCAAPAPVIGYTNPKRDSYETSTGGLKQLWTRQQSFRSRASSIAQSPDGLQAASNSRRSIGGPPITQSPRLSFVNNEGAPPPYREPNRPSLALTGPGRLSESSTAEDPVVYATTTTTQTTVSTTTTFFKMPRRKKKQPELLFPLPASLKAQRSPTPKSSGTISPTKSPGHSPYSTSPVQSAQLRPLPQSYSTNEIPLLRSSTANAAKAASSANSTRTPPSFVRQHSTTSAPGSPVGAQSAPGSIRNRSGTNDSFGSRADDDNLPNLIVPPSGRNSSASTTLGRNSISGFKSLTSRLRHPSEVYTLKNGFGGAMALSQHDSPFNRSPETLAMPAREDGETAGKFYTRVEKLLPKRTMAVMLSKSTDPFHHDVLRSLMRTYKFYEMPLDISMRTLLWDTGLPGESQQIDRVIIALAERYHECNPHVFRDFDQVYLLAFSMVILHSDLYNKNNKRKMQRGEYQKNTGGDGIDEEILGYFYDAIHYTEFITQDLSEEDAESKAKAKLRRGRSAGSRIGLNEAGKSSKPDPYDSIIDPTIELDKMAPSLKSVINLEDTYSYLGNAERVDVNRLRDAFARYGSLEIISARSRPGAFSQESTTQNPLQAQPGVVSIRVVKVGVIWRKDVKRKKTQRPWQPWGALLTSSQLYFFRNHGWIRTLMGQFEAHQKHGSKHLVFKPALEEFKPDASIQVQGAVGLHDRSYDKHKNAFLLARQDEYPSEEILLADNESELNDWLAKINYAATFHWDTLVDTKSARQSNLSARADVIAARLATANNELSPARERLENNLRNARNLQILTPLTAKSRGDLLAYGARVAHRIRWSRYCVWRLQCQKDMLEKDFGTHPNQKLENRSPGMERSFSGSKVTSPKIQTRGPLSRLKSSASDFISPQKPKTTTGLSPRLSNSSSLNRSKDMDGPVRLEAEPTALLGSHNESASVTGGSYLLPPLHLGSGALELVSDASSERFASRPTSSQAESFVRGDMVRQTSLGSVLSGTERINIDENIGRALAPTRVRGGDRSNDLENVTSRAVDSVESDMEQAVIMGSPDSRTKHRRSLHRTLRETRESSGSQQHRGWKGKESLSSSGADDGSIRPEGIPRGTGSFTVHGKKASVITFGAEWQNTSAEERLKMRKQAPVGEAKLPESEAPVDARQSVDGSSMLTSQTQNSSYHSFLGDESETVNVQYSTPRSALTKDSEPGNDTNSGHSSTPKEALTTSAAKRLFDAVRREDLGARSYLQPHHALSTNLRTFFEDASQTSEDKSE